MHPCTDMQVNPDIRKEKWTEDEDAQLIELVGVHGSCWAEISRGMAVRSSSSGWQCRQCWTTVMRPAPACGNVGAASSAWGAGGGN